METGSLIDAAGGSAKALPGDVTAPEFPKKLVNFTIAGFGSLDIIVNNAGYTWDNVIQKTTDEQFQAMLDIHMVAPFRILRAASGWIRETAKRETAEGRRVMRKVVNITSVSGVDGIAGQAGYGVRQGRHHRTDASAWRRNGDATTSTSMRSASDSSRRV